MATKYVPVSKKAFLASQAVQVKKAPSFWDVSKWPEWWEKGAKELEKTSPGKLITAPIRLPEAILTATTKTVQEVPGTVRKVANTLPILAISAAVIGGGYLAYKFKKEGKFSFPKFHK
jgi:hypothetical protein